MAFAEFVERVVARLRQTPVDLALLPAGAVPGSVFTGGAGIAFFLHEAARLRGDDDLLPLARRWCEAAAAWTLRATPAQWSEMPFGFLMGAAGVPFVEALVSAREGDRDAVIAAVEQIDRTTRRLPEARWRATEYLSGAAGVACAARELEDRLPAESGYDGSRALLRRVRARALDLTLTRYRAPLAPAPDESLGFAHGIAGELWALAVALGADDPIVSARLRELAALRQLDEEGLVYWLPSLESTALASLGTWCNGMAGHALLWTEVARQTRRPEWMDLARRCAESVVILRSAGPTLCCGLAGQSMALQRYADLAGDERYSRIAYRRLRSAISLCAGDHDSFFLGFWQGALGVALAAMARLGGEKALVALGPSVEPARSLHRPTTDTPSPNASSI